MEGEQLWWDDVRKHGYPSGWKHGPLTVEEIESAKEVQLKDNDTNIP